MKIKSKRTCKIIQVYVFFITQNSSKAEYNYTYHLKFSQDWGFIMPAYIAHLHLWQSEQIKFIHYICNKLNKCSCFTALWRVVAPYHFSSFVKHRILLDRAFITDKKQNNSSQTRKNMNTWIIYPFLHILKHTLHLMKT